VRVDGDSNGCVDGKNLIAEIQDDFLRCHQDSRGQSAPHVVQALAEIAHGMRVVLERFEDCSNARQGAFAFQTQQEDQLLSMVLIVVQKALFIAKEPFQMQLGNQQQLREEGPGDAIRRCDLRHFPIDALMEPSQQDNMDTGLSISIGSSHECHCFASGRWSVVMNPQDSIAQSSSYHHQGLR